MFFIKGLASRRSSFSSPPPCFIPLSDVVTSPLSHFAFHRLSISPLMQEETEAPADTPVTSCHV